MTTPRWSRVATIAGREFNWHLRRKSFLLTTFGLPILGLVVGAATAWLGIGAAVEVGAAVGRALEVDELRRSAEQPRIGWVDEAGRAGRGARDLAAADDAFLSFDSLADARAALEEGEIDSIFVVPADFPQSSEIVRLARSWAPPSGDVAAVTRRLRQRVWPDAPPALAVALAQPRQQIHVDTVPPPASVAAAATAVPADDPARYALVLAVGLLLYTTIFTASSYLMQSVTTEKENRVIEVLLTSVTPLELLAGKVAGLGLLGGLQLVIWGGFGLLTLNVGALFVAAAATIHFGPTALALAVVYFVFGYLFYASLMGAVGALVPSFQESGPLTFVILAPAIVPFLMLELLARQPNGLAATALSLFPPTAPLVMMLRVASGPVPWWEIALSLALLAAGVAAVLALAARIFATNQLLAGEGFKLRRGLAMLLGRAGG